MLFRNVLNNMIDISNNPDDLAKKKEGENKETKTEKKMIQINK